MEFIRGLVCVVEAVTDNVHTTNQYNDDYIMMLTDCVGQFTIFTLIRYLRQSRWHNLQKLI